MAGELERKTGVQMEEILTGLPVGLDAIYGRLLRQIKEEYRKSASLILKWLIVAQRPLAIMELSVATNIEALGEHSRGEVMKDRLRSCGLLLRITREDVNFVHFSAKEFLQKNVQYQSDLVIFHVQPADAHLIAAEACFSYTQRAISEGALGYTLSPSHKPWDPTPPELPTLYPFLNYAALYWPEHSKLAIDMVGDFSALIPSNMKAETYWKQTPLHIAANYGDESVVKLILKKRPKINAQDKAEDTPLPVAAAYSRIEGVLRSLLMAGGSLLARNKKGKTILHQSTSNKNGNILLWLLKQQGLNANAKDQTGKTTLHDLCSGSVDPNKFEQMIRALLDAGVDIHAKDIEGRTALHFAAQGHWKKETTELMVQAMLDFGADVIAKDDRWDIALHLAIQHYDKLCGADVNVKTKNGAPPLHFAVGKSQSGGFWIKLLIKASADDDSGRPKWLSDIGIEEYDGRNTKIEYREKVTAQWEAFVEAARNEEASSTSSTSALQRVPP
ncbi:MAG: hypothetical protein MMC33_002094 [Icmadophila ericetorum]|nr:hypothetical protein [Icmadophila ericetorum]